jgi:hypothetical protein
MATDRHELNALKRAVLEVPSTVEKQERWRRISALVGTRGKREVLGPAHALPRLSRSPPPRQCYDKFKELRENKIKRREEAAAAAAEKASGRGCEDLREIDEDDDDEDDEQTKPVAAVARSLHQMTRPCQCHCVARCSCPVWQPTLSHSRAARRGGQDRRDQTRGRERGERRRKPAHWE